MSGSIDFGVFLSPERPVFDGLLSETLLCEALGYHSVWFSDHVLGMYAEPGDPRLEAWTTMSALAGATSRVRLGHLVLCNPFRHPPLLAKMAATLDVISGGRLELGIGAGWHEPEFTAYGYPFEKPWVLVRRLRESVEIMKLMWTEEAPSFQGKYHRIKDAYCSPKPVQRPHPPIMIGGSGERLLLRLVAEHADACNYAAWRGTPTDYQHKNRVLERHCRRVGRDPAEIRRSWAAYIIVEETEGEVEEGVRAFTGRMAAAYNRPTAAFKPPLAGTPEEVAEQVQGYVDVGVSLFILRFVGEDLSGGVDLFAREVAPRFR